jgi:hypothetical protein
MDGSDAPAFSAKKLKELAAIAEGRVSVAPKSEIVRLFTRAGATNRSTDNDAILEFGGNTVTFALNAGRSCSRMVGVDQKIIAMAQDLHTHVAGPLETLDR